MKLREYGRCFKLCILRAVERGIAEEYLWIYEKQMPNSIIQKLHADKTVLDFYYVGFNHGFEEPIGHKPTPDDLD